MSEPIVHRHMYDPPAEAYESTWRQAKKLLEDTGPGPAFLLLIVRDAGEEGFDTSIAMSTGTQHINVSDMLRALEQHNPFA